MRSPLPFWHTLHNKSPALPGKLSRVMMSYKLRNSTDYSFTMMWSFSITNELSIEIKTTLRTLFKQDYVFLCRQAAIILFFFFTNSTFAFFILGPFCSEHRITESYNGLSWTSSESILGSPIHYIYKFIFINLQFYFRSNVFAFCFLMFAWPYNSYLGKFGLQFKMWTIPTSNNTSPNLWYWCYAIPKL